MESNKVFSAEDLRSLRYAQILSDVECPRFWAKISQNPSERGVVPLIQRGYMIKHNGSGNRNSWVGVVTDTDYTPNVESHKRIHVTYVYNSTGDHIDVEESYTLDWAINNMLVSKTTTSSQPYVLPDVGIQGAGGLQEDNPKGEEKGGVDEDAGKFIVWSPKGLRPPKYIHNSRRLADREAVRMAKTHTDNQFFVAELVSKTKIEKVVSIENL